MGDGTRVAVTGQRHDFAGFYAVHGSVFGEQVGLVLDAVPVAIDAFGYDVKL